MSDQSFNGPLFLVGMPRSGTKLLRDLLNQHPLIAIPEIETEFLPYWASVWRNYGDLSGKNNFKAFYNTVVSFPYFLYQAERGCLVECEQWYRACRNFNVDGVFEALIRIDAGAGPEVVWGDKSPSYVTSIYQIKSIYPEARFIHITRDVRDYVLSINKAWGKNINRAAQRWGDDVRSAHEQIYALGTDGIEVKYESLIGNVEGTLRMLCSFIGLDYQEGMETLRRPSENLGDAKGFVGVLKDNKLKYKTRLKDEKLKKVEAAAYNTMRLLDYPPEQASRSQPVSAFKMRCYQMQDGVALVRSNIKERGLLGAIQFQLSYFRVTANRQK